MNKEVIDMKDCNAYLKYLKYLKVLICLIIIVLAKSNTTEAQTTTIDFNQFYYPDSCSHKGVLPPQPDPLTIGIATLSGGILETGTNAICNFGLNCTTAYLTCDSNRLPEMTVTFAQAVNNLSFQIYNPGLYDANEYLITANSNQIRVSIPVNVGLATVSIPGTVTSINIVPTLSPNISFYIDNLRFDAVVEKINSLSFEAVNSPIDANPNLGGGLKIFPDKDTPNDIRDKTLVKVKALTSLGAGRTVYFKAFDLDDPFTDDPALDRDGAGALDNRGQGQLVTTSAITDVSGTAMVEFKASKFAGDNFKVAASTDLSYLNSLTVTGIELYKSTTKITSDTVAAVAKTTPMLTVWRRVHVELDSMDKVVANKAVGQITSVIPGANTGKVKTTIFNVSLPNNEVLELARFENGRIIVGSNSYKVVDNDRNSVEVEGTISSSTIPANFVLFDDDDYNSNDQEIIKGKKIPKPDGDDNEDIIAAPTLYNYFQNSELISKNAYADAYIKPIFDGAGNLVNNTSDIDFALNIPLTTAEIEAQGNLGRQSGDVASDDYWVAYIQLGYQGPIDCDCDSNDSLCIGGATPAVVKNFVANADEVPEGGSVALIYLEVIREFGTLQKETTIPHEVGHLFGLDGDTDAGTDIMSYSITKARFLNNHLNVLRWRVHSPGKLN